MRDHAFGDGENLALIEPNFSLSFSLLLLEPVGPGVFDPSIWGVALSVESAVVVLLGVAGNGLSESGDDPTLFSTLGLELSAAVVVDGMFELLGARGLLATVSTASSALADFTGPSASGLSGLILAVSMTLSSAAVASAAVVGSSGLIDVDPSILS